MDDEQTLLAAGRHQTLLQPTNAPENGFHLRAASLVACRVAVKPSRSRLWVEETNSAPMMGGRPRVSEIVSHSR